MVPNKPKTLLQRFPSGDQNNNLIRLKFIVRSVFLSSILVDVFLHWPIAQIQNSGRYVTTRQKGPTYKTIQRLGCAGPSAGSRHVQDLMMLVKQENRGLGWSIFFQSGAIWHWRPTYEGERTDVNAQRWWGNYGAPADVKPGRGGTSCAMQRHRH